MAMQQIRLLPFPFSFPPALPFAPLEQPFPLVLTAQFLHVSLRASRRHFSNTIRALPHSPRDR